MAGAPFGWDRDKGSQNVVFFSSVEERRGRKRGGRPDLFLLRDRLGYAGHSDDDVPLAPYLECEHYDVCWVIEVNDSGLVTHRGADRSNRTA